MKKINVLEVNNIDLGGRSFNGYDMISDLSDETLSIKQATIIKRSRNKNVIEILPTEKLMNEYYRLMYLESKFSLTNVLSIVSPALMDLKEYKEADIVHFHMFHNTKVSLYSLIKISQEKKVILSLHDPWFVTGRCVHFYDCLKWKDGCFDCPNLTTLFPFAIDNCNMHWKLKEKIFNNINIDIVVTTGWMQDIIKQSPIFKSQKNIHLIPFGINREKLNSISQAEARKHFKISDNHVTLFIRAQKEFKGIEYFLEALKIIDSKNITIITCDELGLLDEVKDKYKVIDLGYVREKEMIYAMNACDIFLMPSKAESFGMMAVEAMACKKTVIIFDNTAMPYVTDAPKCGYLVKNKDAKELAKAIDHVVKNPKEREKRGNLGYQLCVNRYDLDKYNNTLKELYQNLAKSKRKNKKIINESITKVEQRELDRFLKEINDNKSNYKIDFSNLIVNERINEFLTEKYVRLKNCKKRSSLKFLARKKLEKNDKLFSLIKRIEHKRKKMKEEII